MDKIDFKFEDGALVTNATGSHTVSFKIVERNHAHGENYYLCAPLKKDGTINKAIRPFRFTEEHIRDAKQGEALRVAATELNSAIDPIAKAAYMQARQYEEMTEKQKMEYFIHVMETQGALQKALSYVTGWIKNDPNVLNDLQHILRGRNIPPHQNHEMAKLILLEIADKALFSAHKDSDEPHQG